MVMYRLCVYKDGKIKLTMFDKDIQSILEEVDSFDRAFDLVSITYFEKE